MIVSEHHGRKKTPEQLAKKAEANRLYRQRRTTREKEAKKKVAELSEKLRHVRDLPTGLDQVEQENRETWLNWAVELLRPVFTSRGYTLPTDIRVALGWPKNRKHLGVCFDSSASSAEAIEIFISPVLDDALEVFDVLVHELCHAAVGVKSGHRKAFAECAYAMDLEGKPAYARGYESAAWRQWAQPLVDKLGPLPHDAMLLKQLEQKKQSTRMLKCECNQCGFVVRTTQKWIDAVVEKLGKLRCPDSDCEGELVEGGKKAEAEDMKEDV